MVKHFNPFATGDTLLCGRIFELGKDILSMYCSEETFLQYFLDILKRTLQNF